jgi:hypothetical protein
LVSIVASSYDEFSKKQEALGARLPNTLKSQLQIEYTPASQRDDFAVRNARAPFALQIDDFDFGDNILVDQVVERVVERLKERQIQVAASADFLETVLTNRVSDEKAVENLQKTLEVLNPLLARPEPASIILLENRRFEIISAGIFIASSTSFDEQLTEERLTEITTQLLTSLKAKGTDEASAKALQAVLGVIEFIGSPLSPEIFKANARKLIALIRDLENRILADVLAPAAIVPGRYAVVTDSAVFEKDEKLYAGEMKELNEKIRKMAIQGLTVTHALMIVNPELDVNDPSAVARARDEYLGRHPQAVAFGRIVFVNDHRNAGEKISATFLDQEAVLITAEDITGQPKVDGERLMAIQLDPKAETVVTVPTVALGARLSGKPLGVPGLVEVAKGIFRYLPIRQVLAQILKQVKDAIIAVGTSA